MMSVWLDRSVIPRTSQEHFHLFGVPSLHSVLDKSFTELELYPPWPTKKLSIQFWNPLLLLHGWLLVITLRLSVGL